LTARQKARLRRHRSNQQRCLNTMNMLLHVKTSCVMRRKVDDTACRDLSCVWCAENSTGPSKGV
jgi:hypothetical protein